MKNFRIKLILVILASGLVAWGAYFGITTIKKDRSQTSPDMMSGGAMDHDMASMSIAQSHRGYDVEVTSDTTNIRPGQATKISYKIVNDKKEVLKDFTVAHEKIMHFILVRKDLQNFQHLHPDFNQQTGEFTVSIIFPADGPYRLFPDFTPTPENPQKLPVTVNYDVSVGDQSKYKPQPLTVDTATSKTSGGFNIDYFFGMTPRAGAQLDYGLTISDPNIDEQVQLESYLGAMGHGVIIKENTLDFIHTHATGMDMEGMEGMTAAEHAGHVGEPDTVDFSATFPEVGKYKIFTQFQVKGKVVTTDYTVSVN
jgi:hypothetical protein